MRIVMPAAVTAGFLLMAGSALADPAAGPDPAKGLLPEQAVPPPAAEPVHVVRGAHNTAGGSLPEPASWGLMIIGFGGVGAILRGQRRSLAAVLGRGSQS